MIELTTGVEGLSRCRYQPRGVSLQRTSGDLFPAGSFLTNWARGRTRIMANPTTTHAPNDNRGRVESDPLRITHCTLLWMETTMAKQLWTVHFKDQTFTRSATSREYSHVILVEYSNGDILPSAWCGTQDLAIQRKRKERIRQGRLNDLREKMGTPTATDVIACPCHLEDAPAKARR